MVQKSRAWILLEKMSKDAERKESLGLRYSHPRDRTWGVEPRLAEALNITLAINFLLSPSSMVLA